MKKFIHSILAGIVVTALSFTNAHAQKIAHIKMDSLIAVMPEYKKAQEDIQVFAKQLEQQIMAMQTEFQEKYAKYMAEKDGLAESIRAIRESELKDLDTRIQNFQQQAQADYQNKSAELIKPINEKAKKAIEQVAKENGYKYVLDTSLEIVVYYEPGDDILPLVLKKLGITTPTSATPAPPIKKQ